MLFEGRHFETIGQIRQLCRAECPLERLVRRPEAIELRDAGGAPSFRKPLITARCSLTISHRARGLVLSTN